MNRLTAIAASLALTAACGGSTNLSDRSRDALPSKESVAIGTPSKAAGTVRGSFLNPAEAGRPEQASKVGDASFWAVTTAGLATVVNGSVIFALGLVETITQYPATTCTATTCTWGPFSGALDPVRWKLVVSYAEATDTFTWALSGEPKAAEGSGFVAVIEGAAKPSGLPHRGSGRFSIDFDASHTLNPNNNDIGKLEVEYSNATPGAASLGVNFLGVRDNDHPGQKLNIVYGFQESGAGGDLDVAWHNTTSNDRLSLHSRWTSGGAGRSDLKVTVAGASRAYVANASECWRALDYKVVYFHTDDPAHLGADDGAEASCAYTPAAPSAKVAP